MKEVSQHIIQTKNLRIGYDLKKEQLIVADELNIHLDKGKFVCLLGKNGIGKSTLLRTLTKIQAPLNGEVLINNKLLQEFDNLKLSKALSLVLTERLPDSNLSVFEIVALGRQPYTNWIGYLTSNDLRIILESLEHTNTKALINKKYFELSDGQLQKVLIARSLTQDTPIIILDEPTAHLDLHHTIETFSLLNQLAKKFNKTIIVSTHEINLALKLADELWLMSENTFHSGTPDELTKNGALEKLFDSSLIAFDKTLKQFTVSNSK